MPKQKKILKKVYITGANGFIGQHLVNYLSNFDYKIYALIRQDSIPSFSLKSNIHVVYGDITNSHSLSKSIPQKAIIINLAANPYDPKLSYQVNVQGVKNLITSSTKKNITKFIQISSQSTKLPKVGVYGKTKEMADQIVKNSNLLYFILKPSLIYGPGHRGLFSKISSSLEKIPIIPIFGSDEIRINPIYINDFVYLLKCIIEDQTLEKGVYELGSTDFISYKQFYKTIAKYKNKNIKTINISLMLSLIICKLLSILKNPPLNIDNVLGSAQDSKCNPFPLLKKYKFKTTDFNKGAKETINPDKVNVAVIGLGKMGILHSTILNTFEDVNIIALIESNKALHPTIKSMGLNSMLYTDMETALQNNRLDAVFVLTPTFTHLNLVKNSLRQNLNIFIEKPLTLNQSELNDAHKIKSESVINVGYTLLYKRTFTEVKKLIESKKFGRIISFKATFEHSEVTDKPQTGWMFEKDKSGGGVMMNPGPHFLSIIYLLFGKPKKITSKLSQIYSKEVEDVANIKVNYPEFSGDISLSWCVKNKPLPTYEIEINFAKAKILTDLEKITIIQKGHKKILSDKDLPPLLQPVFNINPTANGEAYYIEDRIFIDSIKKPHSTENLNNLPTALNIESLIHQSLKNI